MQLGKRLQNFFAGSGQNLQVIHRSLCNPFEWPKSSSARELIPATIRMVADMDQLILLLSIPKMQNLDKLFSVNTLSGAPRRALSCNAKSRPSSQYLFLIRLTVDLLTFNASDISSSFLSSSAKSSILTRVKPLVEDLPLRRYRFSSSSSSSFNMTLCFSSSP